MIERLRFGFWTFMGAVGAILGVVVFFCLCIPHYIVWIVTGSDCIYQYCGTLFKVSLRKARESEKRLNVQEYAMRQTI